MNSLNVHKLNQQQAKATYAHVCNGEIHVFPLKCVRYIVMVIDTMYLRMWKEQQIDNYLLLMQPSKWPPLYNGGRILCHYNHSESTLTDIIIISIRGFHCNCTKWKEHLLWRLTQDYYYLCE